MDGTLPRMMEAGDPKAFARNLKLLRTSAHRLSQRRLADILGVSRSCYARYEQGLRMPPAWFAAKAAAYFHVSMEELFDKEVKPKE